MSDADDEGLDFAAAMRQHFAGEPQAAITEARLRAERRAGMTSKQRAKRAKKTSSLNFRCSEEVRALAKAMAARLDCDLTDVMERAVIQLAKTEGVKLP
jgi:hypothetical protein